jgi:hypothetical protein
MGGLTYDTGALIAAAKGDTDMWALHRKALTRGLRPLVIAPVLAQAWRGGARCAPLARLLSGCQLHDLTVTDAYRVGELLARAGTSDVVDAAVVIAAGVHTDAIVTSDPRDLTRLGDTLGVRLRLMPV